MTEAILAAVQPVLDARQLGQSAPWWASLFRTVAERTGIDMHRQTVPLAPAVGHTLGGLAVDGQGRCVVGTWSRWFTGLYAAGDAACTGLHGAAPLAGNRLLDALTSGTNSGRSAAAWAGERKFSTAHSLEAALAEAEADLSAMMEEREATHVVRCGTVLTNLHAALASTTTFSEESMTNLLTKLESVALAAESLHLDQHSLIANTNLLEILRTQAAVRMVTASFNPDLRDENLVAPLPARISLNQTTSSCTTTPLIKTERSIHSLSRRVQVGIGSCLHNEKRHRPVVVHHGDTV